MPDALRRRRLLLGLTVLALAVRLVHLLAVLGTPPTTYHRTFHESDMYTFDQWAQQIAAGDWLGRQTFHPLYQWQLVAAPAEKWREWYGASPIFFKAPFYAYLLAVAHRLWGDPFLPVSLLQIVVSVASVCVVFRLTEVLFGVAAAAFAGLLMALYAPAIHFDPVLLRGPFIVLVSLVGSLALVRLRERRRPREAVLVGVAVGLALTVNEGFLTLPPLVLLAIACWSGSGVRAATLAAAFVLGLSTALAPAMARNLVVGVSPFKLAVTGSLIYAVFNSAQSNPYFFTVQPGQFVPLITQSGGSLAATVLACMHTFEGPTAALAFYLKRSAGLFIPFENPDNFNFYYAALRSPLLGVLPTYALLFPLGVVGLGLAIPRWRSLTPLLPFTGSLLLSILLTMTLARYRLTLVVFLMPFAGLTVARLTAWVRARHFRPALATVLVATALWLAAAQLQARVVFAGRDSARHLYRAAEFWQGVDFYMQRARWSEASREAFDLARLNPDPRIKSGALLDAARAEARQANRESVADALGKAVQVGGDDAGALVEAGDAYVELLGDGATANDLYRRAAALPTSVRIQELIAERLRRSRPSWLP